MMSTDSSQTRVFYNVDWQSRLRSLLLILAGIAATVVLFVWHPTAWVPSCPVWKFTGLYCPGCGSLRACHSVLNADVVGGFEFNPLLMLVGLPLAAWFWVDQVFIVTIGKRLKPWISGPLIAWVALAVLLGFAVLRNIPSERFEALRPPAGSLSP